jgi:ribonuclease BN (tRNA processing enzyme)
MNTEDIMKTTGNFVITFLGSGSAFYTGAHLGENWQSNVLITAPSGRRLLIDCGSDIRFSLQEQGLGAMDIDDVFISHLHGDHVGGLEWLAFSTKFSATKRKPGLWANRMIMKDLWSHSLRGGLGSLEGELANIRTYFDVHSIPNNKGFEWEGVYFRLVQVVHNVDGYKICPTFGLLFELGSACIFFTADTQFAPSQISRFYRQADIIFHDCETASFKSGVHAHYEQLVDLPAETKKKMWLYHYQAGPKDDACADGFAGWIAKGQHFTFPAEAVAAA